MISQAFTEVRSTHGPVASNIRHSLLCCFNGMLPTVSSAESVLLQRFTFWCGGLMGCLQQKICELERSSDVHLCLSKC